MAIEDPVVADLRDTNRFLRERVVFLESANASLTAELLKLRREGWTGAAIAEPQEPNASDMAVTRVNLPASVVAAIQQRSALAPGGASQLLNFAITALAAEQTEADVVRTILNGVSDA